MFASIINLDRTDLILAKGNENAKVFHIDKQCLTNFLALVKEHFDILSSDNLKEDFGTKDLLNVIRTGGQTASRIAF